MKLEGRLERLETSAQAEIHTVERWIQDDPDATLYRFEGLALTSAEINERAEVTPGLCVIKVHIIYD